MNDYLLYIENRTNIMLLTQLVLKKHKAYINYRANIYSFISGQEKEDFKQDIFIRVYERLCSIKYEKINENFSLKRIVYWSVCDIHKKIDNKTDALVDFEYKDFTINYINISINIVKFKSLLTNRQKSILIDKKNKIHENITLNKLDISHGTYNHEIKEVKKIYNTLFF